MQHYGEKRLWITSPTAAYKATYHHHTAIVVEEMDPEACFLSKI
jgi:hypothetical protein